VIVCNQEKSQSIRQINIRQDLGAEKVAESIVRENRRDFRNDWNERIVLGVNAISEMVRQIGLRLMHNQAGENCLVGYLASEIDSRRRVGKDARNAIQIIPTLRPEATRRDQRFEILNVQERGDFAK
jgi:hypothetical protein